MAPTTITVVDQNRKRRSCCLCVPEIVGVFAILSMYFFFGIFSAAYSFVALGYASDAISKALLSINGCLSTLIAINGALGISAIRKEKVLLMRRLSILFCTLTALMFVFNLTLFILEVESKDSAIQECEGLQRSGKLINVVDNCAQFVNETLMFDGIKVFSTGIVMAYFAYVIYRFAKQMENGVLPFVAASIERPLNTPTYAIYSTQPPTSNGWVPPPPVYQVRASNLPEGFDPDSKQNLHY